jgi:hypothetical protein
MTTFSKKEVAAMEMETCEKRRELRVAVRGSSIVVNHNGRTATGKTVDMTSAGVLLRFTNPDEFAVGDLVTCDFFVEHDDEQILPYWGVGSIVRVEGWDIAIELKATGLTELTPGPASPSGGASV